MHSYQSVKAVQLHCRRINDMMGLKDMKEYCIKEIKTMAAYNPLLDIFYLIIQDQGKSYKQIRTTWIKTRTQQIKLFKET